ncbi:DUF2894 domain-containing protein [Lysobacter niastensis]|nr:DUF2894 domain-containing protein [Lysobacter niastensis]
MLDAWREQGADRLDPVRFHRIDALERRAVGHDGTVRRELEVRLSELIAAYADDLERAAARTEVDIDGYAADADAHAALTGLLGHIALHAAARDAGASGQSNAVVFPELGALADARRLWTRVRTESQLRQSLQPAPTGAGPLNSASLVHRSLKLMRELSPGYLQQFLSYVDTLTWMERLGSGAVTMVEEEPRKVAGSKRAKATPRRPRSKS